MKAIGAISTRAAPSLPEVLLLDESGRLMKRGNGSLKADDYSAVEPGNEEQNGSRQ